MRDKADVDFTGYADGIRASEISTLADCGLGFGGAKVPPKKNKPNEPISFLN